MNTVKAILEREGPDLSMADLKVIWNNLYCILRTIDMDDVKFSDPELQWRWNEVGWLSFREDPHHFIILCGDAFADAIWAAVERRLK